MLKIQWIVGLACAAVVLALPACGQKGALTLPSEAAAQKRATLPQVLNPTSTAPSTVPSAVSAPTSAPASAPTPAPSASAPKR